MGWCHQLQPLDPLDSWVNCFDPARIEWMGLIEQTIGGCLFTPREAGDLALSRERKRWSAFDEGPSVGGKS